MGWFKGWFGTHYYALLYGHRDMEDARAWTDMIVGRLEPRSGARLLDLGCGRGRHAEWFVGAGLAVTGVDLSEPSITEARKRVPQGHFEVHDIREPYARDTFDVVVCLFTSLGYSGDREDDQRAVDAAFLALKPGGAFVLDLMNGEIVCRDLVARERLVAEGVDFTIERRLEGGDIVKCIHVEDATDVKDFEERVHAWRVDEVKAMVVRSGFVLEEVTDGPEPLAFDPTRSERIVVWARKPING